MDSLGSIIDLKYFVAGVIVPLLYSFAKDYRSNSALTNQLKIYAQNLSLYEMVTIIKAAVDWANAGFPADGEQKLLKTIKDAISSK